jgi:hypothetical protein
MSFAVSRTAELVKPKLNAPFAPAFPSLTKDNQAKERGAFEWAGGSPSSLFCQWSNLFNASHWRMVWDIIRFNYQSLETLRLYQNKNFKIEKEQSIGQWLEERGYGENFRRNYLIVSEFRPLIRSFLFLLNGRDSLLFHLPLLANGCFHLVNSSLKDIQRLSGSNITSIYA